MTTAKQKKVLYEDLIAKDYVNEEYAPSGKPVGKDMLIHHSFLPVTLRPSLMRFRRTRRTLITREKPLQMPLELQQPQLMRLAFERFPLCRISLPSIFELLGGEQYLL